MKKRIVLVAVLALLLSFAPGAPVWADDENTVFWGFPGDTWTISNPTDEVITLGSELYNHTYVITDADGNVTDRVMNMSWKKNPDAIS